MIKLTYSVLKTLVHKPKDFGSYKIYWNTQAYHKVRNRHKCFPSSKQVRSISDDHSNIHNPKLTHSDTASAIFISEVESDNLVSINNDQESSSISEPSTKPEIMDNEQGSSGISEPSTKPEIMDNEQGSSGISEPSTKPEIIYNEQWSSSNSEKSIKSQIIDYEQGSSSELLINSEICENIEEKTEITLGRSKETKSRKEKIIKKPLNSYKNSNMKVMDPKVDVDIMMFLAEQKMKYHKGHTCIVVNCLKQNVLKKPNLSDGVYINTTTGYFTCFSCKKHGTLSSLLENWNELSKGPKSKFTCFGKDPFIHVYDGTYVDPAITKTMSKAGSIRKYVKEEYTNLQNTFGFENITKTVMVEHKISFDAERKCLVIPYRGPDLNITDCKYLMPQYEANEIMGITQLFIGSRQTCLFGWREEDVYKKQLILTKTEKDAMAAQQVFKDYCVLSVPRETQLPQEALPYLERFEKVIIWFGCDSQSWETTKKIAPKLGEDRCLVFRPGDECPAPHELLKSNQSLSRALVKAQPLQNDYLTSFKSIRDEVKAEITHFNATCGIKWQRFEMFNKYLKGLRPGELTVMSGRTGTGKTTFVSEYSLDLCMQGVNTLWGSFEVNNVRLMKTMLTQFAKKNLTTHLDEFDYYADRFQELPMFFMTFFGQENIKKVVDTMAHAVYIHDIQHVIVDNLQFMMGTDMSAKDSLSRQNNVYSAFRNFASAHNCHITLVVHPRKENEDTELTTSSIFGSAKITQEADNVMLLQTKSTHSKAKKYIQITKNRFDGEVGNITLKFDPESLTMSQPAKNVKKKEKIEKKKMIEGLVETSFSDDEPEEGEYFI